MTNVLPITPVMDTCDVCGGLNRKLQFRDRTTGQRVGMCCVEALRRADTYLNELGPISGVSHPTPALP